MIRFNLFKKITIVVFMLITTTLASNAATSYEAWVFINGQWRYGTLMSAGDITIEYPGVAHVDPPWAFVGTDGYLTGGNGSESFPISFVGGTGKSQMNVNVTISEKEGLIINAQENIKVEILKLPSAEAFYSSSDKRSITIEAEKFVNSNSPFLLRIISDKGEVFTTKFSIGKSYVLKGIDKENKE